MQQVQPPGQKSSSQRQIAVTQVCPHQGFRGCNTKVKGASDHAAHSLPQSGGREAAVEAGLVLPLRPLLPARSRSLFHFAGDAQTQPPRCGVFYTLAPFTPGCSVRLGSLAWVGLSQEGREIGEQRWEGCPGPAGGPNSHSESAARPHLKVRTAARTRLPCGTSCSCRVTACKSGEGGSLHGATGLEA